MHDVEKINLSLCTKKRLNVDEARQLFIPLIEKLLSKINTDTNIKPYLHNYPFTSKNLCISLRLEEKNGKKVERPYIADVRLMFGMVFYSVEDLNDDMLFEHVHEETYEEALKIYNSEKV